MNIIIILTEYEEQYLTLKAPFMTIVAFVASVDQDQAARNVQPDLCSTLSTLRKHFVKEQL